MARTPEKRTVDGDHTLYHYLQKELFVEDIWLYQSLVARLIASLGIWFHPSLYSRLPFLIPFAVRDPKCRPRKTGDPDHWGHANDLGYFRDDNSLIKNIPRSLRITSPLKDVYASRFMLKGFVACHIWRKTSSVLTTRDNWLYSFVPNLVWLPTQVAKLTDREGLFTQLYLQALASKIYRGVRVPPDLRVYVNAAWERLSLPAGIPEHGLPEPSDLSYFEDTPEFLSRRIDIIRTVAQALLLRADEKPLKGKVISSSYTQSIASISEDAARRLATDLNDYLLAADASPRAPLDS